MYCRWDIPVPVGVSQCLFCSSVRCFPSCLWSCCLCATCPVASPPSSSSTEEPNTSQSEFNPGRKTPISRKNKSLRFEVLPSPPRVSRRFPNWLDRWMLCRKQMGLVALGLALLHAIYTFIIPIRYAVRHKLISRVVDEVRPSGSAAAAVPTRISTQEPAQEGTRHTDTTIFVPLSPPDEEQQNHPVLL